MTGESLETETDLTGTVYGLTDPRTGAVRYVGATVKPLPVRLAGHRSNPSSEACRRWFEELKDQGLAPAIVPLHTNVEIKRLHDLERAEITRRVVAEEPLLNQGGTAEGRKIRRQRRAAEHAEARTSAWRELADGLQAALGGPTPPWPVEIRLADDTWQALQAVAANHRLETRVHLRAAADELVRRDVDSAFPELRDSYSLAEDYRVCRSAVAGVEWDDREQAAAYLSAVPWMLLVAAPWKALAAAAGRTSCGPEFASWVSTDERVRYALSVLERRSGLMNRLADDIRRSYAEVNALATLATLGAAYAGLRPSPLLHQVMLPVLQRFAAHGQLTPPLARLLTNINDRGLDRAYGPDLAAEIDTRAGLDPGTASTVLGELAVLRPGIEELAPILRRHAGRLSTTERLPYLTGLSGGDLQRVRVIVASLAQSGLVAGVDPADLTTAEEVQLSWRVALQRRGRW